MDYAEATSWGRVPIRREDAGAVGAELGLAAA